MLSPTQLRFQRYHTTVSDLAWIYSVPPTADDKFEGWMALDKATGIGGMKWQEFEQKEFEEIDINIKITHYGMSNPPSNIERVCRDGRGRELDE